MILIKPAKPKKERRVPSQLNTKIQKREKYPILIKKEEVIPKLDLGTRNEFKVWDEIIANSQNVELLHSPEEGCGGTTENLGTRWQLLPLRNTHLKEVRETFTYFFRFSFTCDSLFIGGGP